jgi:hypothetical protein
MKQYTDLELEYAAGARCDCGAGMAHPLDTGEALRLGAWVCSDVLKGKVTGEQHKSLPFAFWKVREESSINNHGNHTTRPAGTKCMTQGHATCPQCNTQWQSEPYVAGGLSHHWFSGPCPQCGYAVGGGGSWSSSEGKPIDCRFRTIVQESNDG